MDRQPAPFGELPSELAKRRRQALVLLLSCAAGAVDAATYIGLGHVFAANMTGNTVRLGMAVGQANPVDVARTAAAVVGFLLGAAVGATIVERDDSVALWPRTVSAALFVELGLLVAVACVWRAAGLQHSGMTDSLLVALGGAMGMQSVAIRRLRIPGVASTYLSGTLTTLMAGLTRRAWGLNAPTPEAPTHGSLLLACVWLIYALGAAITTLASPRGGPKSLILPAALIVVVLLGANRRASLDAAPPSARA